MSPEAYVVVLIGGFFGGICRFFVSVVVAQRVGLTFPWGTLVVNVSGALAIGAFAGAARSSGGILASDLLHDFVAVGLCGGYTTVSSFSLHTLNLALDSEPWRAAFNVVASAFLCFAAVAAGFFSAQSIVG